MADKFNVERFKKLQNNIVYNRIVMLITAHLNKKTKKKQKEFEKKYFTDEIFIPKADILRRKCCKQKFKKKKYDDEDNKTVCV